LNSKPGKPEGANQDDPKEEREGADKLNLEKVTTEKVLKVEPLEGSKRTPGPMCGCQGKKGWKQRGKASTTTKRMGGQLWETISGKKKEGEERVG